MWWISFYRRPEIKINISTTYVLPSARTKKHPYPPQRSSFYAVPRKPGDATSSDRVSLYLMCIHFQWRPLLARGKIMTVMFSSVMTKAFSYDVRHRWRAQPATTNEVTYYYLYVYCDDFFLHQIILHAFDLWLHSIHYKILVNLCWISKISLKEICVIQINYCPLEKFKLSVVLLSEIKRFLCFMFQTNTLGH